MRRSCCCTVIVIAALILPSPGRAQVLTPSRVRFDTLIRLPLPTPLTILPPGSVTHICLDCGRYSIRPGTEPAFIIKDSAAHVLAMMPPGDSAYRRDPWYQVLEAGIAAVEVVHDTSLVRVLGRGFENGLVIITLTPAGTVAWRAAVAASRP